MPPERRQSDLAAVAENGDDLAEDLLAGKWGVLAEMRVASGEDTIVLSADHPVRYKSPVTTAQDNTSGEQFGRASPANGQHVSGPDGGQHTGSVDLQAHFSKLTKHLRDQVVPGLVEKLFVRLCWILSHHQETTCSRGCCAVAIPLSRATKTSGCCGTATGWIAPCRIAERWSQKHSRSGRLVSGRVLFSLASAPILAVPLCSSSFSPNSTTKNAP